MKPDAETYRVCEQRARCPAEQICCTDDREKNIAAAKSRGWQTHLFRTAEQLAAQIDEWFAA